MIRRLSEALRRRRHTACAEVFADIDRRGLFYGTESRSGPGSGLERTARLRGELPALLRNLGATSVLDVGCGDFHWMAHVDLAGIEYRGIDVVPELIARNARLHGAPGRSFAVADLARDPLPEADAILCRDVFIHLPDDVILRALSNFRASGARHLIATTFPGAPNRRLRTLGYGWRPVDLEGPPFALGPPRDVLVDAPADYPEKRLGVWPATALPAAPAER